MDNQIENSSSNETNTNINNVKESNQRHLNGSRKKNTRMNKRNKKKQENELSHDLLEEAYE